MCQAYDAEAAFVINIEKKYPECEVCGQNTFWHTWMCEGHPRFKIWFESKMFDSTKAIWRKR
jgi:hypothetical protein